MPDTTDALKTINPLRRLEKAQEFNERLGKLLLKGQTYRALDIDKQEHLDKIEEIKESEAQYLEENLHKKKAYEKRLEALQEKVQKYQDIKKNLQKKKKKLQQKTDTPDQQAIDKINEQILEVSKSISSKEEKIVELQDKLDFRINQIDTSEEVTLERIQPEAFEVNKIIKKQDKLGLNILNNKLLREYSGPGCYAVCVTSTDVRLVKVTSKEDFKETYNIDLDTIQGMKAVEQTVFTGWQDTIDTCARLEVNAGELFALAQTRGTQKTQISDNVSGELDLLAKTYGQLSISLAGIFAEIGAAAEVTVTIGGKYVAYSAKLYAKGKAGIYVSIFGISAAAEAEAGAEHKLSITPKVKEGKFGIGKIDFSIKGYGKAEAKAAIGSFKDTNEDKALGIALSAGVSIGLAVSFGLGFKYNNADVGELAIEGNLAIKLGVGAELKVLFNGGTPLPDLPNNDLQFDGVQTTPHDDGDNSMQVFEAGISISIAAIAGATGSLKGTIKIAKSLLKKGEDFIKKHIKKAIEEHLSKELLKELLAFKAELDHYAKKVTDFKKQVTENTINTAKKLFIQLQTEHKNAVKLEIDRHVNKLENYKGEVEKLVQKLRKQILKDNNTSEDQLTDEDKETIRQGTLEIINTLTDPTLRDWIIEVDTRKEQDLYLDLQKYVNKYDERIRKFNDYVNNEYYAYADRIEKHYVKAISIINEFESLNLDGDKTREKLNKEIDKLNSLTNTFNEIISSKDSIINNTANLHGDGESLPGTDTTEVAKAIQSTYSYVAEHISALEDKIEDIRDELR